MDEKILQVQADVRRLEEKIQRFGVYNLGGTVALGLSMGFYIAHEKGKGSDMVPMGSTTGAFASPFFL